MLLSGQLHQNENHCDNRGKTAVTFGKATLILSAAGHPRYIGAMANGTSMRVQVGREQALQTGAPPPKHASIAAD